ncbi:hypothetical protein [Actinomadura sp. 7K534]|nr:hypothetical protein [Actinomadura sp. 7K534]
MTERTPAGTTNGQGGPRMTVDRMTTDRITTDHEATPRARGGAA